MPILYTEMAAFCKKKFAAVYPEGSRTKNFRKLAV
jgi:hypothetical protein